MSARRVELDLLPDRLAVARMPPDAAVPDWAHGGGFVSITRTAGELSIVCADDAVPQEARAERGFRCLRVCGPLEFSETGILATLAAPLAAAGISIFAISTFDTDHVLVRDADLGRALTVLAAAGHPLRADQDTNC